MKKLIFVLLKIAEMPIIIFVPYWVFMWFTDSPENYPHWFTRWACGVVVLLAALGYLMILGFGLYCLYRGNMKLAEWIKNKFF